MKVQMKVEMKVGNKVENGAQSELVTTNLGEIDFLEAWEIQRKLHAEVTEGTISNQLILCTHPSVYTAGRRTSIEERPIDGTPVIDVDRGGKITWHGPGQIVGYPIVALAKRNDVVGYVRTVERAIIATLKRFELDSTCYPGRTGVWFRDENNPSLDRKISAIGVRTARGVTMHGFALNVSPDLSAFKKILPCGFSDTAVTSMSVELGRTISIEEVLPILEDEVRNELQPIICSPAHAKEERESQYVFSTNS